VCQSWACSGLTDLRHLFCDPSLSDPFLRLPTPFFSWRPHWPWALSRNGSSHSRPSLSFSLTGNLQSLVQHWQKIGEA